MAANPLASAVELALERAREEGATLNERLGLIASTVRAANPEVAEAVDRLVGRLRAGGAGNGAPEPGATMPNFVLPDETGHLVSLQKLLQGGPLAISFHRGHWCSYCRLSISMMSEVQQEIATAGGRVVSIVPERQGFARSLKADAASPFPVLTDIDNGYALSLGLAIWLGEEMQRVYMAAGWDVPRYQGNQSWMLPIPATFVLDASGVVIARHLDPDYRTRIDVDELLAAFRQARTPRVP